MKGQDFSDETLAIVEMAIKGKPLPKPEEWEEMLRNGSWRDILVESRPAQQDDWEVTPLPSQQADQQQGAVPNGAAAAT
jgi:hypothetical protein